MMANNNTNVTCLNPTLARFYILLENKTSASTSGSHDASQAWFQIVVVIICALGVAGNALNLAVLTRRRLLSGMDRMEKSATYGLIALALSDLMFCLSVLPHSYLTEHVYVSKEADAYRLYYRVYGVGLINLFLMVSTWLIVCMAVNRYIVVVYPFHARISVGCRRTMAAILFVYVISGCVTLPFFLHVTVVSCTGRLGETLYEVRNRFEVTSTVILRTYIQWVWPILAGFVPLILLAFCNLRLVKELHVARTARKRSCRGQALQDENMKVTLTLIIIVLLLLVLVAPSEILRYINPYKHWGRAGYFVANVTNVMQAANFAVNFVLYCVINRKFRRTLKNMLLCRWEPEREKIELHTLATQYSQLGSHVDSRSLLHGDPV